MMDSDSDTKTDVCWFSRPSICWSDEAEEESDDEKERRRKNNNINTTENEVDDGSKCCYWNRNVINAIQNIIFPNNLPEEDDEDYKENIISSSEISYANLIYVSSLIICELRKQLSELFPSCCLQQQQCRQLLLDSNNKNDDDIGIVVGIPIVVAIPEGPLLPLATLVVHTLNMPFDCSIDLGGCGRIINNIKVIKLSAIFVPIEPSEAKQRNLDIINDIKPIKILSCSNSSQDYDNLQRIINESSRQQHVDDDELQPKHNNMMIKSYKTNDDHPYYMMQSSNSTTELVKFDELLLSVLSSKQSSTTKYKNDFTSLLLDRRLTSNQSIQSLVSTCSDYFDYLQKNFVDNNNDENNNIATKQISPNNFLDQYFDDSHKQQQQHYHSPTNDNINRISHIVFTSGTTGRPKGCISSINSLQNYITSKNEAHGIIVGRRQRQRQQQTPKTAAVVLLASSLSFDPCFSDIIATFQSFQATLAIVPRSKLLTSLPSILQNLKVTHILCTPTLWSLVDTGNSSSCGSSNNNNLRQHPYYQEFPYLQVIALGGEKIPYPMQMKWARTRKEATNNDGGIDNNNTTKNRCRLFATYGVTEACVYQTFGEILINDDNDYDPTIATTNTTIQHLVKEERGQIVGQPFQGISIRICDETIQDKLVDIETTMMITTTSSSRHQPQQVQIGEVVISGNQCDEFTNYLNRPELQCKFISSESSSNSDSNSTKQYNYRTGYYRTGDRGILNEVDGTLRIIGRIVGEDGMVKINGVRVELGEIESAIIDDITTTSSATSLVTNCCARYIDGNATSNNGRSEIHAFCILSDISLDELGIQMNPHTINGRIITGGPPLELLRARCSRRLKAACMPTSFVIIPRLPLSPTGKRDRNGLPTLDDCIAMDDQAQTPKRLLKKYGVSGSIVTEKIIDCLNLQPSQESMVTASITFSMLGGDSLAATRVTRSLYAYHHQVNDNRFLGGQFGKLDGPFDVIHLLRAKTLGDYVDMLDKNDIGIQRKQKQGESFIDKSSAQTKAEPSREVQSEEIDQQSRLYDALLQATTLGQFSVAIGLLEVGADPNFGQHGGRLGKVSGRRQQKATFRSSPLHLACLKGHPQLVRNLLEKDAKPNTPDASGLFPLHLAASGMDGELSNEAEDFRRLECVKALLAVGVPITMRDGNKQSVLHAAARAGHSQLLWQVMTVLDKEFGDGNGVNRYFQWTDCWCRTPVHWAVLNNRKEALRVLLELGCNPNPPQPKVNNRSSAAVESPMELCDRLYGTEATGKGSDIRELLLASIAVTGR